MNENISYREKELKEKMFAPSALVTGIYSYDCILPYPWGSV